MPEYFADSDAKLPPRMFGGWFALSFAGARSFALGDPHWPPQEFPVFELLSGMQPLHRAIAQFAPLAWAE